jgi:DNA mismatch endonuclease (patch repair protein)
MADVVDRHTRSRMMAGIRGKDTRPELVVRKALFARGHRYRLHDAKLLGKPDLVFPKYRSVVFVHGCFWHGHRCHLFKWPATRKKFWSDKIMANRKRDRLVRASLIKTGWRICTVWECAIKGESDRAVDSVIRRCSGWLPGKRISIELGSR